MTVIETVTSPGGDQVDVVDLEPSMMWSAVRPLVEALWQEGAFRDGGGKATRPWWDAARSRGYPAGMPALNGFFKRGLDGFVERDLDGKRCFEIRLRRLPKDWFGRLDVDPPVRRQPPVRKPAPAASGSTRKVDCPLCGRGIGLNNLHRHLTGPHSQTARQATDLVSEARRRVRYVPAVVEQVPAVVEQVADDDHVEQPVFDAKGTAVDLMLAMLHGVRPALGNELAAWLAQTERTLTQLVDSGD